MAMLLDMLQQLMGGQASELPINNQEVQTPDTMMKNKEMGADPNNITNDSGSFSLDQSNPFLDAIRKSRENDNKGPGVLRQLLDSFMGGGGIQPGTGTVGGGGPPDHTPGTQQDAALNPTPLKSQPQYNLAPKPGHSDLSPPPDYTMPQALDPVSIEELRTSLLTQAGQLDAGNPNGLAGRMSSPNAAVDQRNQMGEAQRQHDSLRGFDGTRQQKIKDANGGR